MSTIEGDMVVVVQQDTADQVDAHASRYALQDVWQISLASIIVSCSTLNHVGVYKKTPVPTGKM